MSTTAGAAERELERLREMFRHAPGAMAVLGGPRHVIEMANCAYLDLVGHREVVGKPVAQALPELVDQGFVALLDRTFERGEAHVGKAVPVALRRGPGEALEERVLDYVFQPLEDSAGRVARIFVAATDVTESAKAESALRDSEERYRAFVANSSEAIWRYELDEPLDLSLPAEAQIEHVYAHARLAELNDTMARMYGLERAEQMVGARVAAMLPRDDPQAVAFLRGVVDARFSVREMVSKERDAAGAVRYFENTMVPVFERDRLVRVWGVQRDVTERRQTQEALRANEERLRSLFAQTLSGIAETDLEGRFLRVNRRYCEIVGRPESELLGLRMQDITHAEDLPRSADQFSALVAGRSAGFEIETRYVRPDGSAVWVHNDVALVHDPQGKPQSTVATAIDITSSRVVEEALRYSEERFRRVIETAPIGIAVAEPDGAILRSNDALLRILGYTPDESDPGVLDWQRFTPPEYLHRDVEHMAALRRGEAPPPFEKEFIRRDGSRVPVLIVARFLPGEGERMVAYALDITARKRAEAALRSTERRLSRIFETNLLGLLYFDIDGGVQDANDEFLRIVGYQRADLVGGAIDWARMTPQEYKAQDARAVAKLRREGAHAPIEKQYVRKDGTRVSVLVGSAMLDVRNGVGFVLDLTPSKRAEAAVRESEARLRSLIDNMTGFVAMLDREGTLLEIGEPALRVGGLRREEVIGAKFWECGWWLHDPEQQRRIEEWVRAAANGATIREDVTARIAEDGRLAVDFMLAPVAGADGSITHVIPSGVDVSERKRVETALRDAALALRDADRRKDEFLATLAHELRNPLAPIRNAVQLMKLLPQSAPQSQAARDIIERQVQHMVRLVDDLLDVSRITLGQVNLKHEQLTLGAVIGEAIEATRHAIEAAGHSLDVHLPGEPLLVEGDATRLSQVFQNVLDNAAKYTPRGGEINVRAERRGGEAVVSVSDTGLGVPEDMRERIFELFTRSHSGGDVKVAGLGVGLALSRQLIELHGGRMSVESEGPGRGSTFSVHLPLLARNAIASPAKDGAPTATGDCDRRVLVVDDNRDAAESLGMLLEHSGCVVKLAFDGEQALDALASFRADIVLLDIGMPGMDGYEVARRMRAGARGRDIFLVALTGWGQEEDKRRAREAGFDEHVRKPVDPALLSALIRAVAPPFP